MAWMQIFGAIAKGAGNIMQAQADYKAAALSADQLGYSAEQAEEQGLDQAALIRRAGRRVAGAQRAGYAAAGVQIGEGSAGELERETVTDTENDAFQAILNGQRQALAMRTQAKLEKISAKASRLSVLIDPLFSNTGAVQGWKTYNPTYQGNASSMNGYDPGGFSSTNTRSAGAIGDNMSWFMRNGTSGD